MTLLARRSFLPVATILLAAIFPTLPWPVPCESRAANPKTETIAISLREMVREAKTADARSFYGATYLLGFCAFEDARGQNLALLALREPGRPLLRLDDFAVAWLNVTTGREEPGCSIDPLPQTIEQLNAISRRIQAEERLDRVDILLRQWQQIAQQPQEVVVFGVSRDTHFARVMVEADYFMKEVVHSREQFPGVQGLFDVRWEEAKAELEGRGRDSAFGRSMHRFWFNAGEPLVYRTEGVAILAECPVILRTEEQALLPGGRLRDAGRADPLAQQFAEAVTRNFPQIAEQKPLYRELENLYRHVAIAKLIWETRGPPNLAEIVDQLVREVQIERPRTPRTLPGKVRVESAEAERAVAGGFIQARTWVFACGGVSVNVAIAPRNVREFVGVSGKTIARHVASSQPGISAVWWYIPALNVPR